MPEARHWTRRIIKWLQENSETLEIVLIPLSIFMMDSLVRAVLRVDLIDAGADMSLLAVSAFLSAFLDDARRGGPNVSIEVFFLLFFSMLWFVCLTFISDLNPLIPRFPVITSVRQFIVWSIGLMAFILASLLLMELARPSSTGL